MRNTTAILFILALGPAAAARAQSVPSTINYQGRLTDNTPQQSPVSATVAMQFAIYDDPAAGARLWREPDVDGGSLPVPVSGGVFSVLLGGNGVPVPGTVFTGGAQRWLQITANGEALTPRQAISATGYAIQALNAASADTAATAASAASATTAATAGNSLQLGGVAAANYQLALATTSCPANQFYSAIGAGGAATCTAPPQNNLAPPVTLTGSTTDPVALIAAANTGSGPGVSGSSSSPFGTGVRGDGYTGITGNSTVTSGNGVMGIANSGADAYGIYGESTSGYAGYFSGKVQIWESSGSAPGLQVNTYGSGAGISARAGAAYAAAVYGENTGGLTASSGVYGYASGLGTGVWGFNDAGTGTYGQSTSGTGVAGYSVTGNAVSGNNTGASGSAAYFTVTSPANASPAVVGATAGAGIAGEFFIANPSSPSYAFIASTNGTGSAGVFTTTNPADTFQTLVARQSGLGLAGSFIIQNGASSSPSLRADSNGAGPAIYANQTGSGDLFQGWNAASQAFRVDNGGNVTAAKYTGDGSGLTNLPGASLNPPVSLTAANGSPIFSATNSGAGRAGQFAVNNGASGEHALFVSNNGGGDSIVGAAYGTGSAVTGFAPNAAGSGGKFSVNDGGNPNAALIASTTGTGSAASLSVLSGASGANALALYHGGSGDFISASNGAGVKFRVDNGGRATAAGGVVFSPAGAALGTDQGGSVELGGANLAASPPGVTPYVDFHFGNNLAQDYNVRLVNDADGLLSLKGRLDVSAAVAANGVEIKAGPLMVDGAGIGTSTTAFIHQTTVGNISSDYSIISNGLTDGDPRAILIVTHVFNPSGGGAGVVFNRTVGVYYTANRWTIYAEDLNPMPAGVYFNVMVIKR